MTHSAHKIVSTLDALINSIDHDEQVYRWFYFLVKQLRVRSRFDQASSGHDLYRSLDRTVFGQRALFILGLLLLTGSLYLQQYIYLWPIALFIYPIIKLHAAKKRWVKEIMAQFLARDFEPSALCQKTLYQISEIYSRKYDIPSFVDAVYFSDTVTRKSLIIAVLCIPFVIQCNAWQALLILLGAYYLPYFIANHPAVFRRLK